MTVLVTGDWHLSSHPRDAYRFDFQKTLRQLIEKHHVDTTVIVGDLTEAKDQHEAWLVNKVVDALYDLSVMCKVFILRGNHDALNPNWPFFGFVDTIRNITWVNKPEDHQIDRDISALFLPHTRDCTVDWEEVTFDGYDYIFCHQTFEGAVGESGHKLPGIPVDVFGDDARVVAGDIHCPQTIGPVTYVGAPYAIDFGDRFASRVLLLDGDKARSIPVRIRQKALVELRCINPGEVTILSGTDDTGAGASGARAGDIVKLRVQLDADDYAYWPEIKEDVRVWAERRDYVIYRIQPLVAARERVKVQTPKHRQQSDEEVLRNYGKAVSLDKPTLDTGLQLIEE